MNINKQYRELIEKIKTDSEKYTDAQMKEIYKEQNASLKTLEALLGAMFIKYGVDGLLHMTSKQKGSMGLKQMLKSMGKTLGTSEVAKVTDILGSVFKDTYYKNAFEMESAFKVEIKFNMLKKEYINAAVNTRFNGDLFSNRIWKNKSKLIDDLYRGINDAMTGNVTIDKIAKDIKTTFNTTAFNSQRLVNNEMARVQSQASIDIATDAGIKKHQWNATLDANTEPEDGELDGKIFDIDDSSAPTIPLHISCRCTWINIPYEGWKASNRKDNITKEVIDYTTYSEWAKAKGINKTKS